MPKGTFKKQRDISRRHFNRLLNKETDKLLCSPNYLQQHNITDDFQNLASSNFHFNYNLQEEHSNSTQNISDFSQSSSELLSDSSSVNINGNSVQIAEVTDDELSQLSQQDSQVINVPNVSEVIETPPFTNCSKTYLSNLSNWAVTFKINHNALNALLLLQRSEPGYSCLPKDSRTLLKTPRSTLLRNVEPGEYHHFGLNIAIQCFLKTLSYRPTEIYVFIGVDGLPISNSSSKQVWPILCTFKSNLPGERSDVYPIGVYHGNEKPYCSNDFLKDFIDEAESLLITGYSDENSQPIMVKIVGLVCGAPAKSFVLKTKGHTGYFSCSRCTQKGKAIGSRVYFPEIDCPLRTHDSFVKQTQPEYHQGHTDLIRLPNFDLIKCIPMDYMHLICLGVVRKLLTMWLFLKKGQQRLSKYISDQISFNLCNLTKYIPQEFARKPRPLSEANRWKATELRMFLLYTGPVVLKDYLPNSLYLNFLTFSIATFIMLSKEFHLQYLDFADALLKWFVKDFAFIYGKQFISHNIHGLIHLKEDVLKYGPLDECSAFKFENYMYTIKKMLVRKPEKPLQQFARRYSEILSNIETAPKEPNSYTVLKHCHSDGPLLSNVPCFEYKELSFKNFILTTSVGNNCCKLLDGSIVLVYNIVKDSEDIKIIGKKFTELSNFFDRPCRSSDIGIFYVNVLSFLKSWPVEEVSLKCMLLPYSDGFVVYPLIHL